MFISTKFVTVLITMFCLAGCSGGQLMKKSVQIEPGYSKSEVLAILGSPENRQFRDDDEAWQYCETEAGFGHDDFVLVWFHKGQVTGINTYKNQQFGPCSAFFRTIRWEDAPDGTIEIRPR
jgi:hypothetical protein